MAAQWAVDVLRAPVRPSDLRTPSGRWRARHAVLGSVGARRYLAPDLSIPDFFRLLERRDVPYAVLRWFETLPAVAPGEDIDLLVGDEHLALVHSVLLPRPKRRDSQAFDVYTVSGLPGSDYSGVPYYPPRFARALLADAVRLHELYRVPGVPHHFQSLAYHAVYHKGYASGLPRRWGEAAGRTSPDHDYAKVLRELSEQLGTPLTPALDDLDVLLDGQGLRPPLDTLERLAPGNPWIRDRFFAGLPDLDDVWAGLAVFVVRERAEPHLDLVVNELNRHGFEPLEVVPLTLEQRAAARERIRGGNWERGPFPLSGGGPAAFVVAYDVSPWWGTGDGGTRANLRIAEAKAKLRVRLLHESGEASDYNPLHSSDNPRQALDYLDVLGDAEAVKRIGKAAQELVQTCAMPFPVLRFLAPQAPARRARVALVDHPEHGPSVCKVYRPGAIRYFEREVRARTELADLPGIPRLLAHGDNWLLTRLYTDDGRHVLRRMPAGSPFTGEVQLRPEASRALASIARELHERGFFVLDLSTENVVSDPDAGLTLLDLEFLHGYAGPVPALGDSYTFRGVPEEDRDRYDAPQDVLLTVPGVVGNPVFHPAVTGLPVGALLRPESPASAGRRAATQAAWYLRLQAECSARRLGGKVVRTTWGRRARTLYRVARAARTARRTT